MAIFRMRNLNSLSDTKQVCLVTNPNSQSSVSLGRSFSVTRNGLCVSVLLNKLDTTVSIQRGKKIGYASPMRTDYEETQILKRYSVKDCPCHDNEEEILERINDLKSIHELFSMKSESVFNEVRNRTLEKENRRGRFRIIAGGFKSERGCFFKT